LQKNHPSDESVEEEDWKYRQHTPLLLDHLDHEHYRGYVRIGEGEDEASVV